MSASDAEPEREPGYRPEHEHGPEPLEAAWSAIGEGQPELALELLSACDPEDPECWKALAWASLEYGDFDAARRALQQLGELRAADELDLLHLAGELALREWRLAEAEASFASYAAIERDALVCERLGFCAELRADLVAADALYAEATRLDPEILPPFPRLSRAAFEEVVREAIEKLPDPFKRALERAQVIVAPLPEADWARRDPAATPPDLLGMFDGASDLDGALEGPEDLPARIFLFQRNLERVCRDHAQLREEIGITLYHELGHMLGFDEEGVDEMGLG